MSVHFSTFKRRFLRKYNYVEWKKKKKKEKKKEDCYECNANFIPIHRTVLALRDGIPFDVENKRCD